MASSIDPTAKAFFDACETGQGWEACAEYCEADATFSAQAGALADVATLSAYVEWMKGLLQLMPDGGYELKSWGVDEGNNSVLGFAVFTGTHTGDGGPVPPTGKRVAADYVYVMDFNDEGKIRHMTKIWNDGHTLKQVGWA